MKKSKYNICVNYNDNWLIYNLLKSTCVILTKNEYEAFEQFIWFEGCEIFTELGLYVEDNYSELAEVFYYIRRNSDIYNQNYRKHRIYTTFDCNAKCPYCFEKGLGNRRMSVSVSDDVIKRIIDKQGNAKNLVITWFGGEPLLNLRVIDHISSRLVNELPSSINYSSFMITNGILFNEKLVKRAVADWRLKSLQITMDGMKETYERIKGYNMANAFERIIQNIHILLNAGIEVRIRINYDDNNIGEILELIDYIAVEFKDSDNVFVYAHRIMLIDRVDNSKKDSADTDIIIWERLYKNNLCGDILKSIKPNMIFCTAGNLYNEMYLPDGKIGKCAQAISDGDIVGDVAKGTKNSKISRWCSGLLDEKCLECKLLPVCGGGCMYEKFNGKNGCFASEKMIRYKLFYYLKEEIGQKKYEKIVL